MSHPAARLALPRARLLAAALAFAFAACGDDPTAPGGDALVSGRTVDGSVGAEGQVRLRYVAAPDEAIEIRFTPLGYGLALHQVRDDGTLTVLVAATVQRDSTTRTVRLVASRRGETIRLTVAPRPGAEGGAFRLTLAGQNRAPESHAAAIALDEMVEERMDGPRDADVYTLVLAAPADVLLAAHRLDGAFSAAPVTARLRPIAADPAGPLRGDVLSTVASVPALALEASSTEVVRLPAGRYELIVERDPYATPVPLDTRYRVQVRRANPGPEERAGDLALGDTVASTIDYMGDVDDWTVRGAPGDSVVAFVQAAGGTTAVRLRHLGPVGVDTSTVARAGLALLATSSGRVAIPASGALTLRVEGSDGATRTMGAYRLFVYRPDTMPEVPQARPAALGETIEGRIELPGDVDVFAVTVPEATFANVVFQRAPGAAGLAAQLAMPGTPPSTLLITAGAGTPLVGSGRIRLDAGTHRLRIAGPPGPGAGFMGAYQVTVVAIDTLPESGTGTIAVGDTVRGETLTMGDVDVWRFVGAASDTITLMIAGATDGAAVPLRATLVDSLGRPVQTVGALIGTGRPGPETGRLRLPRAGTYGVRVAGLTDGRSAAEVAPAPYRLFLERVSARPESAPAVLALGATIRERIDVLGDLDDFEVRAPVGREVLVSFGGLAGAGGSGLLFIQNQSLYYRSMLVAPGAVPDQVPVRVRADGRVRFRVGESGCQDTCPQYRVTGEYVVTTSLVDNTAEGHSGVLALGDTAHGAIDPVGDIDEYVIDVPAGEAFFFHFQRLTSPCCGGGMTATITDAATTELLASFQQASASPTYGGVGISATASARRLIIQVAASRQEYAGGPVSQDRGAYRVGTMRR